MNLASGYMFIGLKNCKSALNQIDKCSLYESGSVWIKHFERGKSKNKKAVIAEVCGGQRGAGWTSRTHIKSFLEWFR